MESKRKNAGFSLIETIAVVVVLCIVALVAVPNVLRVIKKSKINGVEDATKLLAKAAQDYWIENQLDNINLQKVSLSDETLDYDGTKPSIGFAYFDEQGHAYIKMYYDGYCVIRNYDETIEYEKTEQENCPITQLVTLTFDVNGGTGNVISKQYNLGSTLDTLPTPVRYGYKFLGWFTEENNGIQVDENTIINENIKLYAKWEANLYIVSLETNGGTIYSLDGFIESDEEIYKEIYYDEVYGYLPETTKKGHIFKGWYTNGGTLVNPGTILKVANDHTLYAQYEPIIYTITLNSTAGIFSTVGDWTIENGSAIKNITYDSFIGTLPNITRTGYTFKGWFTNDNVEITEITKVEDMISAEARWEANTYTITFESNGGSELEPLKVIYDDTYEKIPTPTKTGYNFLGWYTTGGTKVENSDTVLITKDTTLYANWELVDYTVIFSADGATIQNSSDYTLINSSTANKIVTYGNPYGVLPVPVKDGYNFTGWATSGGTIITSNVIVSLSSNHTLYAQWSTNSYLVTFDANGGSTTTPNATLEFDKSYGELPIPTRTGYTFKGWYTDKTAGTLVTKDTIMSNDFNHSIYARWEASTYIVTLNRSNFGNGEVVYFNPVTAKVCDASEAISTTGYKDGCMKWYAFLDDGGDTINLLLDHNTTGYVAWSSDINATTVSNALTRLNSDISTWDNTIKNTARLISASEVHQIAPTNPNWNVKNASTWYYLHTGTTASYKGDVGTNVYAWLFDNTKECTIRGCNVEQSNAYGYWTSDQASVGYVWGVFHGGDLDDAKQTYIDTAGIRPVITVSKSTLIDKKVVTYKETYGSLPILEKPGYTFTGWYTTGGVKIENTTEVKITSNQILYPQWVNKNYTITFNRKTYGNGEVVYFNPVTAKVCTASEAKSENGIKTGCMKWYAFLDNGGTTLNLILGHNTTKYVSWNLDNTVFKPETALSQLAVDTANWKEEIKGSARLISAEEINQIVPTDSWSAGESRTAYNFVSRNKNIYEGAIGTNPYGWLFDNLYQCESYGCNKSGNTYGYWTSTHLKNRLVWFVSRNGRLSNDYMEYNERYGIRPVIEVSKDLLNEVKNIEYDKTYGSLPSLTKPGYEFLGWYTTGGVKIESTSILNRTENQIVYPQWKSKMYTLTFSRMNFENGEVVYFNPVTAKVCEASEAVSTPGTKSGCMKWYAFLDDGSDSIKLLLDHNTSTNVAWNSSGGTTPTTVNSQLATDVSGWNSSIKTTARLINATEINQMIPRTDGKEWNINDNLTWYYLATGSTSSYQGAKGTNRYAWLFDYTNECTTYGCNVNYTYTHGYWTNDYANDSRSWVITYDAGLGRFPVITSNYYGIRPVITIKKSLLATTKTIVHDGVYGEMPQLENPNYIFLGWYTDTDRNMGSTTMIETVTNQTLIAKWKYKFGDGIVVYFNPTTGVKCTETEAVSTTGTKNGCMKWYSFLTDENSQTVNLILDHNTTGMLPWNTSINGTEPTAVLAQLQSDTAGWKQVVNGIESNLTSRIISAKELNQIAPAVEPHIWDISNYESWYYLHYGKNDDENGFFSGRPGTNEYAWLFDNTKECTAYGCNVAQDDNEGYWTSTFASNNRAWAVGRSGTMGYDVVSNDISRGVRPVIVVDKVIFN